MRIDCLRRQRAPVLASLGLAAFLLPAAAGAVSIPFTGSDTRVSVSGVDFLGIALGADASGSFALPDAPAQIGSLPGQATYCCASPPIEITLGGTTYGLASTLTLNTDIDVFDGATDGVLYSYAALAFGPGIDGFHLDLSGDASVLSSLALPTDVDVLNAFGSRTLTVSIRGTDAAGNTGQAVVTLDVTRFGSGPPVPEPSAALAFAAGLGVLGAAARRRRGRP